MNLQNDLKPLASCLLTLGIRGDAYQAIMAIAEKAARPVPKVFSDRPERLAAVAATFLKKSIQRRMLVGSAADDISWNILLATFEAHILGKPMTVTNAALATDSPLTTAIRHVGSLASSGILVRREDVHDARRAFLEFTPVAFDKMVEMVIGFCVTPPVE